MGIIADPTQQFFLFMLTKADRFLNSRWAWGRARLGLGMVGMLISVLNRGRQISEFFCNVKSMCACCVLGVEGSWDAES